MNNAVINAARYLVSNGIEINTSEEAEAAIAEMVQHGHFASREEALVEGGVVMGRAIQVDRSGIGSAWRTATALPARIAEEIAAEIADGASEYTATNGLTYRW